MMTSIILIPQPVDKEIQKLSSETVEIMPSAMV